MNVQEFSDKMKDAYSYNTYRNGWVNCIRMLRRHQYNDIEIEAILRSKWPRWAADHGRNPRGAASAADLERYLADITPADVDKLVRETFGGTSDDSRSLSGLSSSA